MNPFIYLPIAGNSISIALLLGLGSLVGFLSGLFGVGGGFLLTPLLIMFGIPPTIAAASDSNQIVAASSSGTYAHYRLGNVDFKMGLVLLVGGLLGGSRPPARQARILSQTGPLAGRGQRQLRDVRPGSQPSFRTAPPAQGSPPYAPRNRIRDALFLAVGAGRIALRSRERSSADCAFPLGRLHQGRSPGCARVSNQRKRRRGS